ncbi:TPA: GNAT family N-acetyltransferase [Legionella anisa]
MILRKYIFSSFSSLKESAIFNQIIIDEMKVNCNIMKLAHYKKHRFSLGSVYLKDSFEFSDRAGLIYLNYDEQQPDIEVAYALLPEYGGKGYATENNKALNPMVFSTSFNTKKVIALLQHNVH